MHATAVLVISGWAVLNVALAAVARADRVSATVFALSGIIVAAGEIVGGPVLVLGLAVSMCGPLLYGRRVLGRQVWWHHAVRGALLIGLGALYFRA